MTLLFLAAAILLINSLLTVDLVLGMRAMTRLSSVVPADSEHLPAVSLIVPACNEEEHIEEAMRSLLRQDYADLEIIAVNDRSSDNTGALLDSLACAHEKLRVIHIKNLPEGWMGKAYALHHAAGQAKGEYLLFTDGDIVMERSTIARAMTHMIRERIDHLSLLFKNTSPGLLLNSLILDAGAGLMHLLRPWLTKKKGRRNFIGVGAFNLVRKEAYAAIGGHVQIRMHPIDDIMLGKVIKRQGFSQECLIAYDLVTVPWYNGVAQMVNGLMKNVLALIHYRFSLVAPLLIAIFCLNILPLWAMFLTEGAAQIAFSLTVFLRIVTFYAGSRVLDVSFLCALGTLLSPYIMGYILIRAAWHNHRDSGIFWRGTFYSLTELRKNEPLFF